MPVAKCVFCGCEQDDYMGTYLIRNDGSMNYYCSSKCRKNHLKLKRDRRMLKWTEAFRDSRVKRIATEKKAHEKAKAAPKVEQKAEKHEDRKEHAHKGEKKK